MKGDNIMEWLKAFYENNILKKKNIVNLTVILIIGIIIIIAAGSFTNNDHEKVEQPNGAAPLKVSSDKVEIAIDSDFSRQMEERLQQILSQIDGVGKVSAMITLSSGTESIPAFDTKTGETITEEKDTQGGNRRVSQEDEDKKIIVLGEQGGKQQPLIVKELKPKVKGVIIVAEGAADANVRAQIHDAVKTVLDVPSHKVQVFLKNKNIN